MQNMDWYHNLVKPELTPPDAWFGMKKAVFIIQAAFFVG